MATMDTTRGIIKIVLVAGFLCWIPCALAGPGFESTVPGFAYTRKTPLTLSTPTVAIPTNKTAKEAQKKPKVECTAEYWRVGDQESWPRMIPVTSSVAKVFGSQALEAYGPRLTVLEALGMKESDGYSSLIKESSAALVNAYSRRGFPYSAWKVKTLVIQSLVSQEAAAAQAVSFRTANQACS